MLIESKVLHNCFQSGKEIQEKLVSLASGSSIQNLKYLLLHQIFFGNSGVTQPHLSGTANRLVIFGFFPFIPLFLWVISGNSSNVFEALLAYRACVFVLDGKEHTLAHYLMQSLQYWWWQGSRKVARLMSWRQMGQCGSLSLGITFTNIGEILCF